MYTLAFTLKQHTPIIHFQHDQDGATLRATEVKPKLDKYLLEMVFENNFNKVKEYLIGYEKSREDIVKSRFEKGYNALNYKISFVAEGTNREKLQILPKTKNGKRIYETEPYPLLLANMGGKENISDLKNFSFYERVRGSILTYQKNLYDIIESNLAVFFLLHNFGNRQNKGFGSFTLEGSKNNELSILKKNKSHVWYWEYDGVHTIDDKISDISVVYGLLKSGINFPDHPIETVVDNSGVPQRDRNNREIRKPNYNKKGKYQFYRRSYLFQYFATKYDTGSEKKFIKENLFYPRTRIPKDGVEKKFVRALLGLASFVEFRDKDRNGRVEFASVDKELQRFSSPIVFKVFENKVCFYTDCSDLDKILDKEFKFSVNGDSESVHTPDKFNAIDLHSMLDGFMNYFNGLIETLDNALYEKYSSNERSFPKSLKKVFNTLDFIEIKKY